MKLCKKCNIEKPLAEMVICKKIKCGYKSLCKLCRNEQESETRRLRDKKNKDKLNERNRKYKKANPERYRKNANAYYHRNSKIIYERSKAYKKEYRKTEKAKATAKEYKKRNKERLLKQQVEYTRNREAIDPLFRLTNNIRKMVGKAFSVNNYSKKSKTQEILGCTFDEFKIYFESKFEPWMNWGNKGNWNGYPTELNTAWDIDHIIPLSTAETEEDLIKLCHYTNLQPLCSYTNRHIKRAK